MKIRIYFLMVLGLGHYTTIFAQFSGFNLAEYQLGNIPGDEPQYVHSIYDQLNLAYRLKGFRASVRLENYYSGDSDRTHYSKITQYSLNYLKKGLELKAGNFYETLGKGLLYRGYKIKNSIYEDQIYRVKQGFYRDTRGAAGSYSNRFLTVKALRGRSLVNQLPPTHEDNRPDLVTAGEINLRFSNQIIGGIILQNENEQKKSNYVSVLTGGNLFTHFDYSAEIAHQINNESRFFRFGEEDSYGIYFNLNYSSSGLGISLEYKDYRNLFIGSGISDPPTLVKEHVYRLLNRSTHVPYFFDESGWQTEVFIVPGEDHLLTINHSRSRNDLGQEFHSQEYFAEWQFSYNAQLLVKYFIDYSSDELLSENARYATGVYITRTLRENWSVSVETEFQQIERTFSETNTYRNLYAGLVLNRSTRLSAALICEFTNDVKYADIPATGQVEQKQHFPGINLFYKPNRNNTLQLFAGKRRGGPACTSGICYEVLDFKGVEIRWAAKF